MKKSKRKGHVRIFPKYLFHVVFSEAWEKGVDHDNGFYWPKRLKKQNVLNGLDGFVFFFKVKWRNWEVVELNISRGHFLHKPQL